MINLGEPINKHCTDKMYDKILDVYSNQIVALISNPLIINDIDMQETITGELIR